MEKGKGIWWVVGGFAVTGLIIGGFYLFKDKDKSKGKDWDLGGKGKGGSGKNSGGNGWSGISDGGDDGNFQTEPNWDDPFDMNYAEDVKAYVAPKSIKMLSPEVARKYARELFNARGASWYNWDDEEAVGAVYAKKLQSKVEVAQVSKAFWDWKKKDLWSFLIGFMSSSGMRTKVKEPVMNLPNYQLK